eukprot:scaffold51830_cov32-Tisochrysis_lutea.AAC.2
MMLLSASNRTLARLCTCRCDGTESWSWCRPEYYHYRQTSQRVRQPARTRWSTSTPARYCSNEPALLTTDWDTKGDVTDATVAKCHSHRR